MFSPTDWEKLTPDEEVFGWLKTVFSMMRGKTSTPQTPNQRGLWGNSFPLKILGMPMLKKFHLPNQHAFHFKKGASDSCGMCKTPWCRRSRRNLFPAANLVNVSSSHPSCWGVCSITRASLATSESLATSAWLNKDGELGVKLPGKMLGFWISSTTKVKAEWWILRDHLVLGVLVQVGFPHFPWKIVGSWLGF